MAQYSGGTTPVYLESIMNQPNDYSDYLIDVANRYNEKYTDVFLMDLQPVHIDAAMMACMQRECRNR